MAPGWGARPPTCSTSTIRPPERQREDDLARNRNGSHSVLRFSPTGIGERTWIQDTVSSLYSAWPGLLRCQPKLILKGCRRNHLCRRFAERTNGRKHRSVIQSGAEPQAAGIRLDENPVRLQLNKRDLPNVLSVEDMKKELVRKGEPVLEAVASQASAYSTP